MMVIGGKDKLHDLIQEIIKENKDDNIKMKLEKLLEINGKKEKRLKRIIIHNDRNQLEKINKTKELYKLSESLEKRVQEEIIKAKEKDLMLLKNSKHASMGEMMDAVAHQWKQPISIISMHTDMLYDDYSHDLIDEHYIHDFRNNVEHQISHIFNTLQEFRNFLKPTKDIKSFYLKGTIEKALSLIKDEFMQYGITIETDTDYSFKINGIENEFIHLFLNIINNAKDALNENEIKNKIIKIKLSTLNNTNYMEISDNAGGIPNHIIDDIFKANVTTKIGEKGTGIGLYMSSQIAAKCNGKLSAKNINDGALFTFEYS